MIVTVPQNDKSEKTGRFTLEFITFIVSLGFIANGTFIAWTSNFFQNENVREMFSTEEMSFIASSLAFGAVFGSIIILLFGNYFGRKVWFIFSSILMIISWPMMIGNNIWLFISSRLIAGLGVGILHFLIPIYLLEISTVKVNHILQNILYIQFAIGILIGYIAGIFVEPIVCLMISMMVPILFLFGCFFIPESPNYLLDKGKENEAKEILNRIFNVRNTTTTKSENDEENESDKRINIELSLIGFKTMFKALFSSTMIPIIGLVILEQLTGSISIFFYLMNILTTIKSTQSPELISILVCVLLCVSIPIYQMCNWSIKDKTILKVSVLIMFLSLIIVGTFRHMQSILGKPSDYGYIPLICLSIFIFFYGIGPYRLTYYYVQAQTNEFNCYKIRGISSCFTWITICLCTRLLPKLIQLIGVGWITWYMAIICFITFIFIVVFIPDLQSTDNKMKLLESGDISSEEISNSNTNSIES